MNNPFFLLIISDKPGIRRKLKHYLSNEFYILEDATCSSSLLTAKRESINFIIIDDQIEDCNPLLLCKKLRKIPNLEEIPILLITGRLKKAYRTKALQAGITEFIQNSLDEEDVHTRIASSKQALSRNAKIQKIASSFNYFAPVLKIKELLNKQALELIKNSKKEISLLVIEINNYPELTKNIGPLSLDDFLQNVSKKIEQNITKKDLLIPSHEGKFILISPDKNKLQTQDLAKKIQDSLVNLKLESEKKIFKITTSIAFIELSEQKAYKSICSKKDFDKIISSANQALKKKDKPEKIIWFEIKE
jgi:PleD family two-component response regulator